MSTNALEQIIKQTVSDNSGWSAFGFLRNPFPSRSHPNWEVFYNQLAVRERFNHVFQGFLQGQPTTTMFFTGGNRVGKTHFMEYHRRTLATLLEQQGVVLPISLVLAQFGDFVALCRQIIEQTSDAMRRQTGSGLFESVDVESDPAIVEGLAPGDFRRAVRSIAGTNSNLIERRLLLQRWLRGERLRAPQRAELGVTGHLDSAATLVSAIGGLVTFLRARPRRPGILVFVDEFELLWKHRRDRRDQFLQGLRALIDACPNGLFLCVGMATGVGPSARDLERDYPALFQRLRGARETPALVEIDSITEAQQYAAAFIQNGRERFLLAHSKSASAFPDLIGQREIEELYRATPGAEVRGGTVSQGDFFDLLHEFADKRVRDATAT